MLRRFLQFVMAALCVCTAVAAHAQHGGPGGGGRGGPGGGGAPMGGMQGGGFGPNNGGMRPNTGFGGGGGNMSGPRTGPQLGPPGRWWDDKKTSHTLSLRPDQQKRMDDIFSTNKGQLVNAYTNLQREEQRLGSMSSQELQDESKVFAAIDRVAQARAELEKQNAHILLQIRHELDAGQLTKLDGELTR